MKSERAPVVLLLDHGHHDLRDYASGIVDRGWRLESVNDQAELPGRIAVCRPDIVLVLTAVVSAEAEVALGIHIKGLTHMRARPVMIVVEHAGVTRMRDAGKARPQDAAGVVSQVLDVAGQAVLSSWRRTLFEGALPPAIPWGASG